jgi:hypothetical protein
MCPSNPFFWNVPLKSCSLCRISATLWLAGAALRVESAADWVEGVAHWLESAAD